MPRSREDYSTGEWLLKVGLPVVLLLLLLTGTLSAVVGAIVD